MNTLISTVILSTFFLSAIPYTKYEEGFNSNSPKLVIEGSLGKIMLNVFGVEGIYSKAQAELILKDFFNKKPNGNFHFIFKGKESEQETFAIGTYQTGQESFRITFQFKNQNQSYFLESLAIEKD